MTTHIAQLPKRSFMKVSGDDAFDFLQNLITNDLKHLENQELIYSCLLTPQGKFLHDFFVWKQGDGYFFECESETRRENLSKRLNVYKLRAKVDIKPIESINVFVEWGDGFLGNDPRLPALGNRTLEPLTPNADFKDYDLYRLSLGVPDGSRDMIVEKTTMAEARIDKLNGVDYNKGCYVGQELTARMHYRSLGKKFLFPVKGRLPASGEDITHDGKTIGQMRSSQGNLGLALIRKEHFDNWPMDDITPYTLDWMTQ